ncbi:hypothetical protein BSPA14S_K0032 (plasmid) [Borreliella spielmanii A14S]|uniref:Uncharacterized protein n=1 Tax=Borreliella spielmanii A14S TaxID=498742 RepID=C0RBU2_9SPIR|nr:hypothetical protein BSPA14S_K0032 [Borreliella spielmanii A14S]
MTEFTSLTFNCYFFTFLFLCAIIVKNIFLHNFISFYN